MLRHYAEKLAPEKLRKQIQRQLPDVDVEDLTWAQLVALAVLTKAASGDARAIDSVFKQLEDAGADTLDGRLEVTGRDGSSLLTLEAARAIAANFDKRHPGLEACFVVDRPHRTSVPG